MNTNEPKQQSIMLTFVDKLNTYVCAYGSGSLCVRLLFACPLAVAVAVFVSDTKSLV